MEIRARDTDRELLLEISGDIDHHGARSALKEVEMAIDAALPRTLILDFAGVTFMDSSGIAVALHTLQQVKRLGGKMWIANPSQQAKKVFFAAGIQRMIGMEDAYEK